MRQGLSSRLRRGKGIEMTFELVVVKPFAGYTRGEKISDSALIAKILSGPQANHVVRVVVKGA